MKTVIVLCICAVAVLGAPIEEGERPARSQPAIEVVHEMDERGQYTIKYVTAEGTIVTETGRFVPALDGIGEVLIHEGTFSFVGDDGKIYVTHYKTSIEGGHEAWGDHLPQPVEALPVPVVSEVPEMEVPKVEEPKVEESALVPSAQI